MHKIAFFSAVKTLVRNTPLGTTDSADAMNVVLFFIRQSNVDHYNMYNTRAVDHSANNSTHKHTHIRFMAFFLGQLGSAGTRRNLLDFMVQRKISQADTPTIRLGATPSGLISDPPPSSPIFMLDNLRDATLPIYPGLGQALNMLACIPTGLVPNGLVKPSLLRRKFKKSGCDKL